MDSGGNDVAKENIGLERTCAGCLVGDNIKSVLTALIAAAGVIFIYAKSTGTEVTAVLSQLIHALVSQVL